MDLLLLSVPVVDDVGDSDVTEPSTRVPHDSVPFCRRTNNWSGCYVSKAILMRQLRYGVASLTTVIGMPPGQLATLLQKQGNLATG